MLQRMLGHDLCLISVLLQPYTHPGACKLKGVAGLWTHYCFTFLRVSIGLLSSCDIGWPCVQAAFRGQAQRLHPDHVSDPAKKAEATKRFQALLEAYQVLRDPSKRQAYDRGY